MTDTNLFVVYSPAGEKLEVSQPNMRDLLTHAGFTRTPPAGTPAPAPVPTPPAPPAPAAAPVIEEVSDEEERADAGEGSGEESSEGEAGGEEAPVPAEGSEEEVAPRLTFEAFDDLEDKAAVRAYIEKTFPDFKIDGRTPRDKLVAQAIELATAE